MSFYLFWRAYQTGQHLYCWLAWWRRGRYFHFSGRPLAPMLGAFMPTCGCGHVGSRRLDPKHRVYGARRDHGDGAIAALARAVESVYGARRRSADLESAGPRPPSIRLLTVTINLDADQDFLLAS
jgi:hypothetical protein